MRKLSRKKASRLSARWVRHQRGIVSDPIIEDQVSGLFGCWYDGQELEVAERLALATAKIYPRKSSGPQPRVSSPLEELSIEADFHVLAGAIPDKASINTPINRTRQEELYRQHYDEQCDL